MSKAAKQKWACNKCKYIEPRVKKTEPSTSTVFRVQRIGMCNQ